MSFETVIALIIGLFISYILPKISPYLDKFFHYIGSILFTVAPRQIKNFFKSRRLKKLLLIRKDRYNQDAVTFQSIKAHVYFMLFWLVIGFYLLLMFMILVNHSSEQSTAITPLNSVQAILLLLLITSPIYIFEFLWLKETSKAKVLIKNRGFITKN